MYWVALESLPYLESGWQSGEASHDAPDYEDTAIEGAVEASIQPSDDELHTDQNLHQNPASLDMPVLDIHATPKIHPEPDHPVPTGADCPTTRPLFAHVLQVSRSLWLSLWIPLQVSLDTRGSDAGPSVLMFSSLAGCVRRVVHGQGEPMFRCRKATVHRSSPSTRASGHHSMGGETWKRGPDTYRTSGHLPSLCHVPPPLQAKRSISLPRARGLCDQMQDSGVLHSSDYLDLGGCGHCKAIQHL